MYAGPCVLKSWLQNQFIQATTTSFSRQRNETLSMIHGSFPALFLSCTADRTEVFPASNMDLQCILCIVNSSSAVKTPKDEVTCDTYWNFYKKLKILTCFPQNKIFQDQTEGWETTSQNGRLLFKTVGLEHMDIIHLLELITEIPSFLKIFSVRKQPLSFFNISENLQENQQNKLYFWHILDL